MTTSNSTDFTITAAECIQMALADIGVIGEGDAVSAYDLGIAQNKLNLMIKSWQNQAEHLWVRQKAILFLQYNQPTYEISLTGTDSIALADDISRTQLSAATTVGSTSITVHSSVTFSVNDKIGIQLDNGTFFWSTISSIPSTTTIHIAHPLTSVSSAGLYVYGFTTRLTTIFNLYQVTRRLITSGLDTPLTYLSYKDYMDMPNKLSLGTPNSWSYDRQADKFFINIWMNPSNVNYYLNLVIDRKIQDIDVTTNTFDFPQEWAEAIELNLAVKLAPTYGKAQGDNFAILQAQAKESLIMALENDNEFGSIYINPSRSGIRGRT